MLNEKAKMHKPKHNKSYKQTVNGEKTIDDGRVTPPYGDFQAIIPFGIERKRAFT